MVIITRYVLKQIIEPFFLALVAFTSVLLVDRVFILTKYFVEKGVNPWYMVEMLFYYSPAALVLTVPMACLVGIVTAFGRMSEDNEIIAMKTAGIGMQKVIAPVVISSSLLSVFMIFFMDFGIPEGNKAYTKLYTEIRQKNPALILEADTIMEEMSEEGRKWYFKSLDEKTGIMKHLRIWEKAGITPNLITAKEGRIDYYDKWASLNLYDGSMYQVDQKSAYKGYIVAKFTQNKIILDISRSLDKENRSGSSPRSMSIKELKNELKKIYEETESPLTLAYVKEFNLKRLIPEYRVELYKKISIPFANLAFGLIGVPLGLMVRRGGRMVGLGVGVGLIIVYYVILTAGEKLAKTVMFPPFLGAWTPNILMALAGVALIVKTIREAPIHTLGIINKLFPKESE